MNSVSFTFRQPFSPFGPSAPCPVRGKQVPGHLRDLRNSTGGHEVGRIREIVQEFGDWEEKTGA